MNRLYYVDQIRFRAVCKSWREANVDGVKYTDKLPWMMAFNSSCCLLYDPNNKRKYTVFNDWSSRREKFIGVKTLDGKNGWMLFCREESISTTNSLFFYSPFIDSIIELPKLWFDICTCSATFSTTPLSPDCVVFVLRADTKMRYICICKPGDERWTKLRIPGSSSKSKLCFDDAEYVDGLLYCISSFCPTEMCTFNVARREWKTYAYPPNTGGWRCSDYLTEFDGNLFLSHYLADAGRWRVLRFDPSRMDWFKVENLDDKLLLLNRRVSICCPVDKGSEFSNTILAGRFSDRYIYIKESEYESRRPSHPKPKLSQIYDWNVGKLICFWIQPPLPSC